MRYKVPLAFWDDHCERLPCDGDPQVEIAVEVSRTKRYAIIEADEVQRNVLLLDARHYAHRDGPDCASVGLRSSARATVAALER